MLAPALPGKWRRRILSRNAKKQSQAHADWLPLACWGSTRMGDKEPAKRNTCSPDGKQNVGKTEDKSKH